MNSILKEHEGLETNFDLKSCFTFCSLFLKQGFMQSRLVSMVSNSLYEQG